MKRYRSIKRVFWEDEKPASVSRDARLLFLGMISFSDDHGRLRARPQLLKGQVFPYGEESHADIAVWLGELHDAGLISLYGPIAQPLAHLVNFTKHQYIRTIQPSDLPEPGTRNHARFSAGDLQAFTALHVHDSEICAANAARKVKEGRGEVREQQTAAAGQPSGAPAHTHEAAAPTDPTNDNSSSSADALFVQVVDTLTEAGGTGTDRSMWDDLVRRWRSKYPDTPAVVFADVADRMWSKVRKPGGKPFAFDTGSQYWSRTFTDVRRQHATADARPSNVTLLEPKRRTAAELLAEQERIWGETV